MSIIKDIGFLFDLDGVLIDSEKIYTATWKEIEEKYPTGIENFAHKIKGTTLVNILETYFPKDKHQEIMEELYSKEDMMRFDYCPGAEDFLRLLGALGIPSAIVTSSNTDKMKKLYHYHPELPGYVDIVLTSENVKSSKPDPEGYLKAAEAIGVRPEDAVVVEDSLQGVKAGKNAGSVVIGMTGTIGRNQLAPYADILLDTLQGVNPQDIISWIKERRHI